MQLHSKQFFLYSGAANTSYTMEELELLWDTFSTAQLDFIQEMCESLYNAGYKACTEDSMG